MLGDLGKLIVAKGFKKLPKVQKIARSGHTAYELSECSLSQVIKCLVASRLTELHVDQKKIEDWPKDFSPFFSKFCSYKQIRLELM